MYLSGVVFSIFNKNNVVQKDFCMKTFPPIVKELFHQQKSPVTLTSISVDLLLRTLLSLVYELPPLQSVKGKRRAC